MKKIILAISLLILLSPIQTKAACSDSEVVSLSKMVNEVSFTPVFNEDTRFYSLIVTNLNPNFYFVDVSENKTYTYTANEIVLYPYIPRKSYRFKFYSALPACAGNSVLSKYVTLTGYNPYYKAPVCQGLETYPFCQKWSNYDYRYEEIVELARKYKQANDDTKTPKNTEIMGFYDYVLLYYSKYYYIILPIIIVVGLIVIVRKRKQDDFF
ncbi:MAG: hypothetical protein PHN72_00445 [Bacilli bacterium]|nr:hypothetical protein [Bacilli bacterium]